MKQSIHTLYVKDDDGVSLEATTNEVMNGARRKLRRKFRKGKAIRSPSDTEEFMIAELATEPHEIFCCLYLSNRHHVIAFDRAFHGTIDGTSMYPRVIVKRALELNSAAVIFAHQHPSGIAEPSQADERITQRLKSALELVDIRVLDHLVIGGDTVVSLASRGLL
jgi:DNA repair protein RadC